MRDVTLSHCGTTPTNIDRQREIDRQRGKRMKTLLRRCKISAYLAAPGECLVLYTDIYIDIDIDRDRDRDRNKDRDGDGEREVTETETETETGIGTQIDRHIDTPQVLLGKFRF